MLILSAGRILSVAIGLFTLCGNARAGVIAGLPDIYGPGTPQGVPEGDTVIVNNDNAGAENPNRISLVGIEITGLDAIDIRIPAANSLGTSGTTEYIFTLGTAVNLTNSAWSGFLFELGSGVRGDFRRLSDLAIPGVHGLDFDTPARDPVVSSPNFQMVSHNSDLITFSGGVVPVGEVASAQSFSIDIPDTTNTANPAYNFTVRLRAIGLLGDFERDGDVDGSDFLLWQRQLNIGPLSDWEDNFAGGASSVGDFDRDGDVDGGDFLVWQRNPRAADLIAWRGNFGRVSLASNEIAIPEPTAVLLLIAFAVICFAPRSDGTLGC